MKNIIKKTYTFAGLFLLLFLSLTLVSCHRDDDETDDLPQEELSDILLVVEDLNDGTSKSYDYQINGSSIPKIVLTDGHTYEVEAKFLNGEEDATEEIREAKDEHFLTYNFPNSDIVLAREDDASTTRADGSKVGVKTKWIVNKAVNNTSADAQLILTLYHESVSVSEESQNSGNGTVYGIQSGGETDAQAQYNLSN